MKKILVLHDVASVQRLNDIAKIAFGLNYLFVITKPSAAAAQIGIPELYKIAYKKDKPIIVLPDISDVIDLFNPSTIITISYHYGEIFDPSKMNLREPLMIITSGTDTGLTKKEAFIGKPVKPPVNGDLGPVASTAIILYMLEKYFARSINIPQLSNNNSSEGTTTRR